MNWINAVCAVLAVGWLAGCARYESVDPKVNAEATPDSIRDAIAPQADPEQYRISVEIPVDDVTIDRGQNLDVDALLDERTSFTASDFHLREVVLIARSRRGGSAELLLDEWASGAIDIPEGTALSWYEVRIPAADVGEAGIAWVIDFTGALDLNLLVAVLEPRSGLLAQADATVREVALADQVSVDSPEPAAAGSGEVVHSVEVVETAPQTAVKEVAVVEQPVYRTRTVYRYLDRPVYSYRVSWIYDPARYYVFRGYRGWTYRYFPGTWDWRCYDLSFRLPQRHHHHHHGHHGDHRHRPARQDGRRYDRHDGGHRGDRERRRGEGPRHDRDQDRRRDRDQDGRGDRRAVVSRPAAFSRRVDPWHPRVHVGNQHVAPRIRDVVERTRERSANPRLRTLEREEQAASGPSISNRLARSGVDPTQQRSSPFQRQSPGATTAPSRTTTPRPRHEASGVEGETATDNVPAIVNARIRTLERREGRLPERRGASTDVPRRPVQRPPVLARTSEPRPEHRPNAPARVLQRRDDGVSPPRTASTRTVTVRRRHAADDSAARGDSRRVNTRARTFPRERTVVSRERRGAETPTFQRRFEPRIAEPLRSRTERTRAPSQPRSMPPRETSTRPARSQRTAPVRQPTQRERPAQRAPSRPQSSDSDNNARPDDARRSNPRTRAFERR